MLTAKSVAARCSQILRGINHASSPAPSPPLIRIQQGTFYRHHPATKTPSHDVSSIQPLFKNLDLSIPSFSSPKEHWAILSPASLTRTSFLQVLQGQLICLPPTARSYPYLSSDKIAAKDSRLRYPETAIAYVGFDNEKKAFGGAYLSARYESRVEEMDFTVEQYFTGITGLNVSDEFRKQRTPDEEIMLAVAQDLELLKLFKKPVSTLSNGQSRRARIGKALLTKPEMLLLDAPFIGLDPFVTENISRLLHRLSESYSPRVVVSLQPQDVVPSWVTHLVYAGEDSQVKLLGTKEHVLMRLKNAYESAEAQLSTKLSSADFDAIEMREVGRYLLEKGDFEAAASSTQRTVSVDGFKQVDSSSARIGEPIVEMEGVNIKYSGNSVLGDWSQTTADGSSKKGLWWEVRRGERWGIFGPNGSGKTTLISLITSDHPQTYSAPIRLFGRSRLPAPGQPGISIFDVQARTGHASPEVHALFPRHLSVRTALESAFGDTPLTKPKLNADASARVEAVLRWFSPELNPWHSTQKTGAEDLLWSREATFRDLSFSSQRVLLFVRALIRQPDIVILDEAFSGMDDHVRGKCLLFLSHGETMEMQYDGDEIAVPVESRLSKAGQAKVPGLSEDQALLCVSHSKQDVPGCMREWICLPESGNGPPRLGRLDGPVELDVKRWDAIWCRTKQSPESKDK